MINPSAVTETLLDHRVLMHCPDWCVSDHAVDMELAPKQAADYWIVHDGSVTLFGEEDPVSVPVCQTQSNLLDGTIVQRGLLLDNTTLDRAASLHLAALVANIAGSL